MIFDHVIVDSNAALTLANPAVVDYRRIMNDSIKEVDPAVIIQGVDGKPVKCTQSCSMYVFYTDPNGEHHKFVLDNCYICNVVRTPLVSASHLVSKGCEIHLTKTGHRISFPNDTESELETSKSGLIALLPKPLAEIRAHGKFTINPKGINQITIKEENGRDDTPSQLTTSRPTTINRRDNYEVEVEEVMPSRVTDNETECDSEDDPDEHPPPLMSDGDDDSDDETFTLKEGNQLSRFIIPAHAAAEFDPYSGSLCLAKALR
jgi:hypothetical protein